MTAGRLGHSDRGELTYPAFWGNLPAGESLRRVTAQGYGAARFDRRWTVGRWIARTAAIVGLAASGCAGGGGYRATSQLFVYPFLKVEQVRTLASQMPRTIASRKFARDIAAASGVPESRFKLHACAPDSRGLVKVAVDAPSLSDAKAVSSRLAIAVSDAMGVSPEVQMPGPPVQPFHPPVIEKNPSGSPTC
jgi:hypothetical protein